MDPSGSDADHQLRRLAEAYRVAVDYHDWRGGKVTVPAGTLRAVLAALGVDAATEAAVRDSLREAAERAAFHRLPPVSVVRQGGRLRMPPGAVVEVVDPADPEGRPPAGPEMAEHGPVGPDGSLPADLPLGWYGLRTPDGRVATLAHVPDRLRSPRRLAGRRLAGLMAQLYSVRSRGAWGMGDLADLAVLARWSGRTGAGFVLVNPLHATDPVPPVGASPYLPVSRRFASPLYLRVERVPEYRQLSDADRRAAEQSAVRLRADTGPIDRNAVWAAKAAVLERVHATGLRGGRAVAYRRFREREGRPLTDFATWCALTERYGKPWRRWPVGLRDPRSPEVAAEADRLASRVDFHAWLQWLLVDQLDAAQRAARDAGMPLGVVHDLAVGVDPDGADTWLHRDVFADGVTVGVPPDEFNRLGQDWHQPPWHPGRLAAAGYAPYRDLVRYWLRRGGGLRVDHVMGLFRLWWVPDGASPRDGTYVYYDHEAMLGILALEAHLADAVLVGEDLGTVEPWVRDDLASRGVLGTSLLWFEERDGSPRPPGEWRTGCLATVDSHDMPPVAGYASGEFLDVRHRLGLLGGQTEDQARAEHAAKIARWRYLLVSLGLLADRPEDSDATDLTGAARVAALTRALHRFLTRTPAVLVGLALPDLVGERRSQNLPGTDREYPNWRIPLGDGSGRPVPLDDLIRLPEVADQLRDVAHALSDGPALSDDRGGAPRR